MTYPSDLPRTLSRAGIRATTAVVVLMAFGALTTFDIERGLKSWYDTSTVVPEFDGHLIDAWSMMQLRLVQTVLVLWVAFLGILMLLDRSVRRGSDLALAAAGALGVAAHFVNLPLMAWDGVGALYDVGLAYRLDAVPGFLDTPGFSPVDLVSPRMRLRLDPLAWGLPATGGGWAAWLVAAGIWAATLAVSAAAIHVGLSTRLARPRAAIPA